MDSDGAERLLPLQATVSGCVFPLRSVLLHRSGGSVKSLTAVKLREVSCRNQWSSTGCPSHQSEDICIKLKLAQPVRVGPLRSVDGARMFINVLCLSL